MVTYFVDPDKSPPPKAIYVKLPDEEPKKTCRFSDQRPSLIPIASNLGRNTRRSLDFSSIGKELKSTLKNMKSNSGNHYIDRRESSDNLSDCTSPSPKLLTPTFKLFPSTPPILNRLEKLEENDNSEAEDACL